MARAVGDLALAELAAKLSPGLNRPVVALALDFWTWTGSTAKGSTTRRRPP